MTAALARSIESLAEDLFVRTAVTFVFVEDNARLPTNACIRKARLQREARWRSSPVLKSDSETKQSKVPTLPQRSRTPPSLQCKKETTEKASSSTPSKISKSPKKNINTDDQQGQPGVSKKTTTRRQSKARKGKDLMKKEVLKKLHESWPAPARSNSDSSSIHLMSKKATGRKGSTSRPSLAHQPLSPASFTNCKESSLRDLLKGLEMQDQKDLTERLCKDITAQICQSWNVPQRRNSDSDSIRVMRTAARLPDSKPAMPKQSHTVPTRPKRTPGDDTEASKKSTGSSKGSTSRPSLTDKPGSYRMRKQVSLRKLGNDSPAPKGTNLDNGSVSTTKKPASGTKSPAGRPGLSPKQGSYRIRKQTSLRKLGNASPVPRGSELDKEAGSFRMRKQTSLRKFGNTSPAPRGSEVDNEKGSFKIRKQTSLRKLNSTSPAPRGSELNSEPVNTSKKPATSSMGTAAQPGLTAKSASYRIRKQTSFRKLGSTSPATQGNVSVDEPVMVGKSSRGGSNTRPSLTGRVASFRKQTSLRKLYKTSPAPEPSSSESKHVMTGKKPGTSKSNQVSGLAGDKQVSNKGSKRPSLAAKTASYTMRKQTSLRKLLSKTFTLSTPELERSDCTQRSNSDSSSILFMSTSVKESMRPSVTVRNASFNLHKQKSIRK